MPGSGFNARTIDADHEQTLIAIAVYKRTHPQVIIKSPSETVTGRWEVSFRASACVAFDDPKLMLVAISMVSMPEEDDETDAP